MGLIVSHMREDDWAHSNFAGDLGQEGLANGGKEMEDPELGLKGLAGSRDQRVSKPVEGTEAIGEGHSTNLWIEGDVAFNSEVAGVG